MLKEIDTGVRRSYAESAEILDELVTRSRGEIKNINSPKVTSTSGTPAADLRSRRSPQILEKAYSPRVNELKHKQSPSLSARGVFSPKNGEARPSKLGDGARGSL